MVQDLRVLLVKKLIFGGQICAGQDLKTVILKMHRSMVLTYGESTHGGQTALKMVILLRPLWYGWKPKGTMISQEPIFPTRHWIMLSFTIQILRMQIFISPPLTVHIS